MKVLMIEDNSADVAGIIDYCSEQGWEQEVKKFDEGLKYIEEFDPDIIVLDLQYKEDESFPGTSIFNSIWDKSFRPVCVFSGQIVNSTLEQDKFPSPLVRFVDKGDESPVKDYLAQIAPYANCIREIQKSMREAFRCSFDVFELIFKDSIKNENVIAYLCTSRMRDSFSFELRDSALPAWGQYIYPSLSEHLSTGDVVCLEDEFKSKAPQDRTYYVIMSQSCDIIHKKIPRVLAVKCKDKKSLRKDLCLLDKDLKSARKKLSSILNTGYSNRFFILPSLGEILPDLIVDMKDICTIEFGDLDKYKKIISLSSPYCERLVWAYMQNACRPGVPTLDVEKWVERLIPDNGSNE